MTVLECLMAAGATAALVAAFMFAALGLFPSECLSLGWMVASLAYLAVSMDGRRNG